MSIAIGGLVAFAFRGANLVVALGTLLIVSRELPQAQSDAFILGLTLVGIANALTGGLTAATAYQVANQRRAPGEAFAAAGIPASGMAFLALVTGAFLGAIAGGTVSDMAFPVAAAAAAVILNSLVAGVYLGRESFFRYNLTLVASPMLALAAIAVAHFALDAHSARALFAAYAVGQWMGLALMLGSGLPLLWGRFRPSLALARRILRFAALAGLSSGVSYLNYRADLFVVEHFEGEGGVSTYAWAVYIGESIWQVSGSLTLATYARLGALSRVDAAALTTRVMRHTVLLLALLCAILFLAADLIEAVLAPDYEGVSSALRLLLPGVLIYGLAQSYSGFYTFQRGLPWVSALVAGTGLAVDIVFALLLVPPFGVNGAAAASSIAYGSAIITGLLVFAVQERVRPVDIVRFGRADLDDYRALACRARAKLGG